MPSLLSFDIEIANVFELLPGQDLDEHAPFDISVAATATAEGAIRHWHACDAQGRPCGTLDARLAREVLTFLRDAQLSGARVCAWNGLSFDLRWLAHAAGEPELAREVALGLYDPLFQFATLRGFPIGLAAVADGFGLAQKKLMAAERAPIEWRDGRHQLVLDYVAGDCTLTNQVVAAIERTRCVRWRTKKGEIKSQPLSALRPVREVLRDPPPDQSWMSTPKSMESYWAWMRARSAAGA